MGFTIRRVKNALLLGAAILTATLAVAQKPRAASAFDQQLIDQQKQLLQAIQSKNPAAVSRAIADDFAGIGTNGDFYDRSEIVESAQDGAAQNMRAYDFQVIKLTADSAVVTYNLIVPGEHPRYRHMADTWARVDGRWKLKFQQLTPNLWSAADLD
jgi:hypothetical protein